MGRKTPLDSRITAYGLGGNARHKSFEVVTLFKKTTIILLALIFLFSSFVPVWAADSVSVSEGVGTIGEIMEYIHRYHIDGPELDQLVNSAIGGMLYTLEDPYTEYFSADIVQQFTEELNGDYVGIGIQLETDDPYPRVVEVIAGSPAANAGIIAGDMIIKVDNTEIAGWELERVVEAIKGDEGSSVKLGVRRQGSGDLEFQLARTALYTPTVEKSTLPGNIGLLSINSFGENTSEEFKDSLAYLLDSGTKGLILDLRNDPGGYLQAAVDIASNFLPSGTEVVTTVDKEGSKEVYRSSGEPIASGLPVVILVNNLSASSAEVLAGALQDHGVAKLVGDRTYGKGVVQAIIPLKNGGAIKLTVASYLTPAGRYINGIGIYPDRVVLIRELQLFAAGQVLFPGQTTTAEFKLNSSDVIINGQKINQQSAPFIKGGHVFLPLRFTLEALGFQVEWQESSRLIRTWGNGNELLLPLSGQKAVRNGSQAALSVPLSTRQGVSYLPLDALSLLGVQVDRNGSIIKLVK